MNNTIKDITSQIKIIILLYGVLFILHTFFGNPDFTSLDLLKATLVSFLLVSISVSLKNLIKKPNLPGFAWATLVSFFFTLPISPFQEFILTSMKPYIFSLVGLPLLAFAGISVGDQLKVFKELSWKIVIVSFIVMASTYFGSALISNIVMTVKGVI